MSLPTWVKIKDQSLNDKKHVKTPPRAPQIRNYSSFSACKNYTEDNKLVTDLLAELQDLISENVKLQNKNSSLELVVAELQCKNDELIYAIRESKVEFEKDLSKLQDDIQKNESNLISNSKKCLQQQRKQVQEIEQLKVENELLKLDVSKQANDSTNKIKTLESELKLLKLSYNTIQSQNDDNIVKSTKYKNKLKYAITIINDLNSMLIQHTSKSNSLTRETQTEEEQSLLIEDFLTNQSDTAPQQHIPRNHKTEDLILSDIFFKSQAFCDNELIMFNRCKSLDVMDDTDQ